MPLASSPPTVRSTFHTDKLNEKAWSWVTERLQYVAGEFESADTFNNLKQIIDQAKTSNVIFYLAVSSRFFGPIAEHLGQAGLLKEEEGAFRRVVIEKPFGTDLASAEGSERAHPQACERKPNLPNRPLSGQGHGTEHHGRALRQRHVRADVAARIHRSCADHGGGDDRRGSARRFLRADRRVARHGAEPPVPVARHGRHGTAEFLRRRKRCATRKPKIFEAMQPAEAGATSCADSTKRRGSASRCRVIARKPDVAADSTTETYVAAARVYRELALGRCAVLPAHRQAAGRAPHRDLGAIEVAPFRLFRDTPVDQLIPNVLTLRIDPAHGTTFDFNVKVPGPVMQIGAGAIVVQLW